MFTALFLAVSTFVSCALIQIGLGPTGLWGHLFEGHTFLKVAGLYAILAHLTITAMSLCFHRMHTHQAVKLHPAIDKAMQVWLWCFTSMSKRDWVSVHAYHHATSDTALDPHSPVEKGFWHVFFLGAYDYTLAKNTPEVLKIRKRIPENRLERFIDVHLFVGPILLATFFMVAFGPMLGLTMMFLSFITSPLFAVGGVNALAHFVGYRNYKTSDNSRNIGFLFPLNWILCGELDHNNHHHLPHSASFRHRWYEFDIGWVYLNLLSTLGLAKIKSAYRLGSASRPAAPKVATPVFSARASEPALEEIGV